MNVLPKSALFTRLFKMLAVSLALVAAGVVGMQGASAAPTAGSAAIQAVAQQNPPSVAASWECVSRFYTNGLERNCNVYSGEIRSYLRCSNGVTYYTPWLGRGSWYIRQVCPSPYTRSSSGIQSRG